MDALFIQGSMGHLGKKRKIRIFCYDPSSGETKWARKPPHQIYVCKRLIQRASRTSTINSSAAASRYRLIVASWMGASYAQAIIVAQQLAAADSSSSSSSSNTLQKQQ